MASIKIVLRQKQNADGTFPLALRITKDRKSSFVHIGHSVLESQWDAAQGKVRKSHPNATRLNNLLLKKLSEANSMLMELQADKNDASSRAIRSGVKGSAHPSFLAQAKIYTDSLKQNGKFNQLSADQPRINRFKEFNGGDITFKEITVPLLTKFRAYLKGTRNISERTIVNHLIVVRTLFNQAIAANVVDQKYYPFGKGKIIIKFPDSLKLGLIASEVTQIENLELEPFSKLNDARNTWLLSFYFAGMCVSDAMRLKWVDFQNDRLLYIMGKNDKGDSLKIPVKAAAILERYSPSKKSGTMCFRG